MVTIKIRTLGCTRVRILVSMRRWQGKGGGWGGGLVGGWRYKLFVNVRRPKRYTRRDAVWFPKQKYQPIVLLPDAAGGLRLAESK